MRNRHSRRRDGSALLNKWPYGALAVIALASTWFLWPAISSLLQPKVLVDAEGCLRDDHTPAAGTILVDATDKLTETHLRQLNVTVDQALGSIPDYGRISVFVLQPNGLEPKLVFTHCLPPRSATMGRKKLLRDFRLKVDEPLKKAIAAAAAGGSSETSPIFETMVSVSRTPEFQDAPASERHLFVISDFEQNANGFSVYGKSGKKNLNKQFDAWLQNLPSSNLQNTQFHATVLLRSNGVNEKVVLSLINQFKESAGVASVMAPDKRDANTRILNLEGEKP